MKIIFESEPKEYPEDKIEIEIKGHESKKARFLASMDGINWMAIPWGAPDQKDDWDNEEEQDKVDYTLYDLGKDYIFLHYGFYRYVKYQILEE